MAQKVRVDCVGRILNRNDGALIVREGINEIMLVLKPSEVETVPPEGLPPKDWAAETYTARQAREAARTSWELAVFKSEGYRRRVQEIIESQKNEPYWFELSRCAYQGRSYYIDYHEIAWLDLEEKSLLVKHFVVSQRQQFKRLSREIQAFENLERMTYREVIPESVRIFVWQRDQGRCVECHRRDALEFDHIIPVAEGGSSTERNVQLLCQTCNRSKGKKV